MFLVLVQIAHIAVRAFKVPGFTPLRIGRQCEFAGFRGYLSPWYRVCTKVIFISKESYDNGEPKNVYLVLVQIPHLAERAIKVPGFMPLRIGPTVRICRISGLPFAMLPCLHQSNIHIKRKLRQWGAQKCTPCFSANSPFRGTGLQSTRFHAASYRADSANLRDFEVCLVGVTPVFCTSLLLSIVFLILFTIDH